VRSQSRWSETLFFAGEATPETARRTVNGALEGRPRGNEKCWRLWGLGRRRALERDVHSESVVEFFVYDRDIPAALTGLILS